MNKLLSMMFIAILLVFSIDMLFSFSGTYSPVLNYLIGNGGVQTWWSSIVITVHDSLLVLTLFLVILFGVRKLTPELMTWKSIVIIQAPVAAFIFLQNILPIEVGVLTPYTASNVVTSLIMMFGLLGLFQLMKKGNPPIREI